MTETPTTPEASDDELTPLNDAATIDDIYFGDFALPLSEEEHFAGLRAVFNAGRTQALEEAAQEFHERLPDGTGNGRAYNSHQVVAMLRARAAAIQTGEPG